MDEENSRRHLEALVPNVTFSVELPHNGNGNLYQARTTVSEGLIFYGRADSEESAILKCCQKAVKHLMKSEDLRSKQSQASRGPVRKSGGNGNAPRKSAMSAGISSREMELRSEMGDVLDRVAQWSSKYDLPMRKKK